MSLSGWLRILAQLGPQVLLFTPLAPIAPLVVAAIGEAEALAGATGPDKLAHVVNIATIAASAANAQAGHVVIDPATMQAAAENAISTVVGVTNMVHYSEDAPPALPTPAKPVQ